MLTSNKTSLSTTSMPEQSSVNLDEEEGGANKTPNEGCRKNGPSRRRRRTNCGLCRKDEGRKEGRKEAELSVRTSATVATASVIQHSAMCPLPDMNDHFHASKQMEKSSLKLSTF